MVKQLKTIRKLVHQLMKTNKVVDHQVEMQWEMNKVADHQTEIQREMKRNMVNLLMRRPLFSVVHGEVDTLQMSILILIDPCL
jgi:hypothetical protein